LYSTGSFLIANVWKLERKLIVWKIKILYF
jgi:hypothetical protein